MRFPPNLNPTTKAQSLPETGLLDDSQHPGVLTGWKSPLLAWLAIAAMSLVGASFARSQAIVPQSRIPLFNGTSLGGLYPWFNTSGFSDPNQVFQVENGMLHVTGNGWGALTTNERYRNYVMVLEFKWGSQTWGSRQGLAKDSGLLFHSTGVEGGWNGLLMPSIQAQMIDGGIGDVILLPGVDGNGATLPMSVTTPIEQVPSGVTPPNWNYRDGYRSKTGGNPVTFNQNVDSVHWSGWDPAWQDVSGFRGQTAVESPDGEWNQMVVIANNDTFEIYLNGTKINEGTNVVPSEGKIQLEVEFAEFFARRWELWPLGHAVGPVITVDELPGGSVGTSYNQLVRAAGASPLTWSIADGNLPTGLALNSATGQITGTPTASGLFSFNVRVTDTEGEPADQAFQITTSEDGGVLVTTGLVLRLDSTQGVTASGATVSGWTDLSGNGNHVVAGGNPQLGAVLTPLGLPTISLDGADDLLQRTATLTGLPVGNADRTIFLVAKYNSSTAWAGIAYGTASNNQSFGLNVKHPEGELVLHGYGGGNDLVSAVPGTGAGWMVQSGLVSNSRATHFKNGTLIGQFIHDYDTVAGKLVIGADIGNTGFAGMDVAALLIYDRALSAVERANVESYLQSRYLINTQPPVIMVPANITAEATDSSGAVVNFVTSAIDNAGANVATTSIPASGSVFPIGYTTVTTTAVDTAGNSTSATFIVTVLEGQTIIPQTVIPLLSGNPDNLLYTWSPDLELGNVTDRFDVQNGTLHVVGNEGGGVISKDRYRDYLMVVEYKWGNRQWDAAQGHAKNSGVLIHSRGHEGGHEGRNMPGLEVQFAEGSAGDILLEMGTDELGQLLPMSMSGMVRQVDSPNSTWNYRGGYRWDPNGTLTVFDEIYGTIHWYGWDPNWEDVTGYRGPIDYESPDGQWNQVVVKVQGGSTTVHLNGTKMNEILDCFPSEGKVQLENEGSEYFVRRWELRPLGSQVGPSIRNDSLPAGIVGEPYLQQIAACAGTGNLHWSLSAGALPPGLTLNPLNGMLSGTSSQTGTHTFTVTVADELGLAVSQQYQLSIDHLALVTNGLVLHLDSTDGVTAIDGTVSTWADISGNGNDLTAVNNPQLGTVLTPMGHAAISLDGADDSLERTSTLNGFPVGNTDRTIFLVAKYNSSTTWAGVAYGTADNNQSFGLNVKHPDGELVLHGYGEGNDLVSAEPGVGAGWLVQSGLVSSNTATLFKNGTPIGQFAHGFDTVAGKLVIGADIGNAGFAGMDVAAILIYDRALSAGERANMEAYLRNRYLVDTQPPVITVPADVVAQATDSNGAVVNFITSAIDNTDGNVAAVNSPAPGSVFPLGVSTVTVTATDGAGNLATASFPVTVHIPIENWRQTFYGTTANTGNAADLADPYGTGIPNLMVFALLGPNQNPSLASTSQLPQLQLTGGNAAFSFTQPAGVSGITYGAEWSSTLLNDWQAISDTGTGGYHHFSVPTAGDNRIFMRLKATNP